MAETSWTEVRAAKTMRKSTMLLDLNAEKSDEEVWHNFNNLINEDIVSDYMSEFCNLLCEPSFPVRLSLVTEYLPSIITNRKKELTVFAIAICANHNDPKKAIEYIEKYKKEYGSDKIILIEELNYYVAFDSTNTKKISSLMAEIKELENI